MYTLSFCSELDGKGASTTYATLPEAQAAASVQKASYLASANTWWKILISDPSGKLVIDMELGNGGA